jgi:hypothetical protein
MKNKNKSSVQMFDTNKNEQRYRELQSAWSRGQITWQQFEKAEEYKFSLNQLLFWESCSFWDKVRVVFGRKEYPEQDIYDSRSVDFQERENILSKIIRYTSENGIMISLDQMKSFDPLHDRNYKENWEEFVRENKSL